MLGVQEKNLSNLDLNEVVIFLKSGEKIFVSKNKFETFRNQLNKDGYAEYDEIIEQKGLRYTINIKVKSEDIYKIQQVEKI